GQTQPYFAMEYIEGLSLGEYVDRRRLGVRQRLDLIARICDAVHHAHQKGVIHRDLKPGNILVDAAGQPKILDFGVARVTDSDMYVTTMQTDVGQLVGTVPYMSPEQVAGESDGLDTRSDVYALGVVCYQLLTGRLPHDLTRKVITEAARIIREVDPPPLSMINRSLRGDVETIIAKTLEKDRDRRYQSASELAADIRRYLNDEPIVARPASAFYQIGKFARRNKAIVTATIAVIVALAGGLIFSNIQRTKAVAAEQAAREEALRAKREARKAARVVAFLEYALSMATPVDADGRDMTVAELMDASARVVEKELADEPIVLASVQTTIGRTLAALARYDEA
ncbi:MAG: serine/threonine protein kinase, partial [Phycisphaerales bacterium]|nr:serine/threonine protein kinase [Phycisphaerales bacterium]